MHKAPLILSQQFAALRCFCYVVVCNHHFHDKSPVHKSYTNRFPLSHGSSLLCQFDFLRSFPVTTSSTDSHTCTSSFIIFRLRLRICPAYYAAGYREGKCFETINFWIWEVPNLKHVRYYLGKLQDNCWETGFTFICIFKKSYSIVSYLIKRGEGWNTHKVRKSWRHYKDC